jgi:hypothetical protein
MPDTGAGAGARVRAHLEDEYGIQVSKMSELDQGVFRVSLPVGPAWVARIFPAARPVSAVGGDAEILRFLAGQRFRAERPAASDPVSELDGQGVLVTEYVDDVPRQQRRDEIRRLGGFWTLGVMLGELHTLPAQGAPGAIARPATTWPKGCRVTRSPRRPGSSTRPRSASPPGSARRTRRCAPRWRASTPVTGCRMP